MLPITSYFTPTGRQRPTKPQNSRSQKKRKQNATESASEESSAKRVKSPCDTGSRQQLSNRTKSLNKPGFGAVEMASSSDSSSRPTRNLQYATPKSLEKPTASGSRVDRTINDVIDLTSEPEVMRPNTDRENPFVVHPQLQAVLPLTRKSVPLPPTPFSTTRARENNQITPSHSSSRLPHVSTTARPTISIAQVLHRDHPSAYISSPNTPKRSSTRVRTIIDEIIPETPRSSSSSPITMARFNADVALAGSVSDLSQAPSSQSHEIDKVLPLYRKHRAENLSDPDENEIVPSSQSQDVDSMFHIISPRRVQVLRQLRQDRRIVAAAEQELAIATGSRPQTVSEESKHEQHEPTDIRLSDEIIPSSQSQDVDTMLLAISPRRIRVMRQLEQSRRISDAAEQERDQEIIPSSQAQEMELDLIERTSLYEGNTTMVTWQSLSESVDRDLDTTLLDSRNEDGLRIHDAHDSNAAKSRCAETVVLIDDEDIQSLFQLESQTGKQAAAVVRVDSETEDDDNEIQPAHSCELVVHQPPHSHLEDENDSVVESLGEGEPPVTQPPATRQPHLSQPESLTQSWNTDVSAYSYPPAALDFLDMFEEDL